MPQKFGIARIISSSKDRRRMQVVVHFQGRSVTRHIVDGVGRHPDDNVPRIHARMTQDIADCQAGITGFATRMAQLEKLRTAEAKDLLVATALARKSLEARLESIKLALSSFEGEDPLMVKYHA